ncbi:DUF6774 domain-containing protein [Robinsoniella peoriensis]|uniref:DUF6774 domain-containing protein n=1 Tax=Robinsoniella peoriensis TaxID=180332 RepID=UPI0037504B9D
MQSCELVATISAIACAISKGKSPDEIALMATIFSQLGDTLATISAQEALCAPNNRAAVTPTDTLRDTSMGTSTDASTDTSMGTSTDASTDTLMGTSTDASKDTSMGTSTDTTANASTDTPKDTE